MKDVAVKISSGMKEIMSGNDEKLGSMLKITSEAHRLEKIVEQLKEELGGFMA